MLILAIETTCDETSCSVVRDGSLILSNVVASQVDVHALFGGVVPELACRQHIDIISSVCSKALKEAGVTLNQIDLIAVAKGPGLVGALLVGINFAKGLAFSARKPLIGINHIEAHLYAAIMTCKNPSSYFPALGLVLSGGHTSMIIIDAIGSYTLIGQTVDDAIGEAFDKVAKMLELPYPGGPEIEKLAITGNPTIYPFQKSCVKGRPYDFSFSGIKTKVRYTLFGNDTKNKRDVSLPEKANIAASFQEAVFSDIVAKANLAIATYKVKGLFFGGGVTRNRQLRKLIEYSIDLPHFWPEDALCLDNAAMLAGLAFHKWQATPKNLLHTLEPETRMPF